MDQKIADLLPNTSPENGERVYKTAIVIAGVFAVPHGIDEKGVYVYAPEIGDSPEANTVWDWATNKEGHTTMYEQYGSLSEWLQGLATFSDEKWSKKDLKMLSSTVNWYLDDPSKLTSKEEVK